MENNKSAKAILESIFSNINSWLNFAEAKNAALIAFNIAIMAALLGNTDILLNCKYVFYTVNTMMLISSGLALWSFKPDTGNNKKDMQSIRIDDNLLLYSHAAKYTKEKYLVAIYKNYLNEIKQEDDLLKIELDYADEITYNARITVNKYKWFWRALWVDLISLVGIFILFVIA